MNKDFRLALIRNINQQTPERAIDFTRYDLPAREPSENTRKWSLLGDINQKQTRPQDKPVLLTELPPEVKSIIRKYYPFIFQAAGNKKPKE